MMNMTVIQSPRQSAISSLWDEVKNKIQQQQLHFKRHKFEREKHITKLDITTSGLHVKNRNSKSSTINITVA